MTLKRLREKVSEMSSREVITFETLQKNYEKIKG